MSYFDLILFRRPACKMNHLGLKLGPYEHPRHYL